MLVRIFTIPIHGGEAAAEELNRFLGGHRIHNVDRALVQDGANSAWTLCVSYDPAGEGDGRPAAGRRDKVDYREVLSPEDFAVYAQPAQGVGGARGGGCSPTPCEAQGKLERLRHGEPKRCLRQIS